MVLSPGSLPLFQAPRRITSRTDAWVVLVGRSLNRMEKYDNEAVNVLSHCLCRGEQVAFCGPLCSPLPKDYPPAGRLHAHLGSH